MTNDAVPPDHPASQSDDGSYQGEEHSLLDGPDRERDHHDPHRREPRTVGEAMTDPDAVTPEGFQTTADHSHVYHNMMRIGFTVGLPVGVAIAMFVALLLLSTNGLIALIIAFFTYLGTLAFSKAFFVHAGAEGETH